MSEQSEKYIVVIGNLEVGFVHMGPFKTPKAAEAAVKECCAPDSSSWRIIPLFPKSYIINLIDDLDEERGAALSEAIADDLAQNANPDHL